MEISTASFERLKQIAAAEDRTVANVLSELLHSALRDYQPAWVPSEHIDGFTQRAHRVLHLAQQVPAEFSHHYIGTEHVLLGLVDEGGGLGAAMLARHGVGPQNVREQIVAIVGRGADRTTRRIEFVPRVRKVLGLSADEARALGHDFVGTGHVLLGLLREGGGIGAAILDRLGVVRDELASTAIRALTASNRLPADS